MAATAEKHSIHIVRRYQATPEKVWRALTQPEALKHEQFFDAQARDHHAKGWQGCLARLERLVG